MHRQISDRKKIIGAQNFNFVLQFFTISFKLCISKRGFSDTKKICRKLSDSLKLKRGALTDATGDMLLPPCGGRPRSDRATSYGGSSSVEPTASLHGLGDSQAASQQHGDELELPASEHRRHCTAARTVTCSTLSDVSRTSRRLAARLR